MMQKIKKVGLDKVVLMTNKILNGLGTYYLSELIKHYQVNSTSDTVYHKICIPSMAYIFVIWP